MDPKNLEKSLEGINHLLSHLHLEVTALETSYSKVLNVLRTLKNSAEVDELTGLLRRAPFFETWQALLEECQKLNENSGVIIIDVDHFKSINDTYGHPTGDEVLTRIGELLKQFESPRCAVGRFGGEEFVVAASGNEEELKFMAEQIRKRVERLGFSNESIRCTVSLGVASAQRENTHDATRLLKAADQALYAAKHAGRNQTKIA